jgi:hypothetical protein
LDDLGPYPSIGSTAYSRCPDQNDISQAVLLPAGKQWTTGVTHPDDPERVVQFTIDQQLLVFDQYISQQPVWSKAQYHLKDNQQSQDGRWIARTGATVNLWCKNGLYLTFPWGEITRTKYYADAGQLTDLDPIERLHTEEDEDYGPPPDECDDPFTDEVEPSPCETPHNPSTPVGIAGTQSAEIKVYAPPPVGTGGSSPMRYMCNATFWYESYSGGARYLVDVVIDFNSCAWESY